MSDVPTIFKKTFRFHVKYIMIITKCTFNKIKIILSKLLLYKYLLNKTINCDNENNDLHFTVINENH